MLVNLEWFSTGEWIASAQRRRNSDHKPILLHCPGENWGPKPFKFFNCWLEDTSLVQVLRKEWESSDQKSIHLKFKKIKEYAREWNKSQFGNIDVNIRNLEKEQEKVDLLNLGYDVKENIKLKLEKLYRKRSSNAKPFRYQKTLKPFRYQKTLPGSFQRITRL